MESSGWDSSDYCWHRDCNKLCTRLNDGVVFDCVLQYTKWINLKEKK